MKKVNTFISLAKNYSSHYYCMLFLLCFTVNCFSQDNTSLLIADISKKLQSPIQDSVQLYKDLHRTMRLSEIESASEKIAATYKNLATWHLGNPTIDSTVYYLDKTAQLYKEQKNLAKLAETYLLYEDGYKSNAQYDKATQYAFKALEIYEAAQNSSGTAEVFIRLSDLFSYRDDYKKGVEYAQKSIDILSNTEEYDQLAKSYQFLAANELFNDQTEKALFSINKAIVILKENKIKGIRELSCRNTRGNILKYLERYDEAITEYTYNLEGANEINDIRMQIASNGNLGHIHIIKKEHKEAIPYLLKAIELIKKSGNTINLWENYMHASNAYEKTGDFEKALAYERLLAEENKLYYRTIISRQEDELAVKYETAKKEETISEQESKIDKQRKVQLLYFGLAILFSALLLGMFLSLKNIRKKRKELVLLNEKLNEKSAHLKDSNIKLSDTITNLKTTQAQLIQSEKMASLGELTAGIAHEIQNPLNFVNNFSEVSNELIDEMNEELDKGEVEEAKHISKDIKQNLEKINHHGKRADAIVKGMLQHSRSSSGVKEPTDINKLADEYLRLAYHGLRAKDKSFNATLETDFDETIGLVNVIPQDMGRVILNLITNAFYATNERKEASKDSDFKPTVSVSTKSEKGHITISVKDNGNGIPKHVIDKIFQPFFTTKPTGEGTGLGLSMSYDIVTKGHGGELKVKTQAGIGTTFTIQIPNL
jgi:two-component system, NtrC family, sensor kinase